MVEKNCADAEHRADAYAEFRAVFHAEQFAECCTVICADLRAESGAETLIDFGRNKAQ